MEELIDNAKKVGLKLDNDKPKWSLIPKGILCDIVYIFTLGENKYDKTSGIAENWKYVSNPKARYYDAFKRHVDKWWDEGIIYDVESGRHHLAHAIVNLMFLIWFDKNK